MAIGSKRKGRQQKGGNWRPPIGGAILYVEPFQVLDVFDTINVQVLPRDVRTGDIPPTVQDEYKLTGKPSNCYWVNDDDKVFSPLAVEIDGDFIVYVFDASPGQAAAGQLHSPGLDPAWRTESNKWMSSFISEFP